MLKTLNLSTVLSLLVPAFILLGLFLPVYAQENASPSAQQTGPLDSYVAFWPLSPGKTEGESLYSLKLLKEKTREWLIFDQTKKVDYQILLGTKRVLEAEKLIKENKLDETKKTLNRASNNFSKAYNLAKSVAERKQFNASKVRKDRLINVKILIDLLKATTSSDLSADLDKAQSSAQRIMADYLP